MLNYIISYQPIIGIQNEGGLPKQQHLLQFKLIARWGSRAPRSLPCRSRCSARASVRPPICLSIHLSFPIIVVELATPSGWTATTTRVKLLTVRISRLHRHGRRRRSCRLFSNGGGDQHLNTPGRRQSEREREGAAAGGAAAGGEGAP